MFKPIVLCAVLVFICQVRGAIERFWTKMFIEQQIGTSEYMVGLSINEKNKRSMFKWDQGTEVQGLVPCGSLILNPSQHSLAEAKGGCRAGFICVDASDDGEDEDEHVPFPVICRVKDKVLTYCGDKDINSLSPCDNGYLEQNGLAPSRERKKETERQPVTEKKEETYYTYTIDEPEPKKISLSITTTKGGANNQLKVLQYGQEVTAQDELVPCSLLLPKRVMEDRWKGGDGTSCSIELACSGMKGSTKCVRDRKMRLLYCGVSKIVNPLRPCES